jgi:hypothetical protein
VGCEDRVGFLLASQQTFYFLFLELLQREACGAGNLKYAGRGLLAEVGK